MRRAPQLRSVVIISRSSIAARTDLIELNEERPLAAMRAGVLVLDRGILVLTRFLDANRDPLRSKTL
jgi:hypothetical protein